MPIELTDDTREPTPSLKLPNVGDSAVFHLVDANDVEIRNFDTGLPETYPDGNPKMQKVLTVQLVSASGTAIAGTRDEPITPTPGELYSVWCGASGSWAWRQAVKALRQAEGRGPAVGDVIKWELEREEPAKQRGMNPRKVRTFAIRPPKPDEVAGLKAAETAHMARTQPTPLEDTGSAYGATTEPF